MNKQELETKIEELKHDISETEIEINDLEVELEDIEWDLDFKRNDLNDMEHNLAYYEQQLRMLQSPEEQLPYWIELLHDDIRAQLDGQFQRNGKWYLCNGYVLLESNNKLPELKECEGMDSLPKLLDYKRTEITIDIDSLTDEQNGEDLVIDGLNTSINTTYLLACKHILNLDNDSKFYKSIGQSGMRKEAESLICENNNGRALILGKVNL